MCLHSGVLLKKAVLYCRCRAREGWPTPRLSCPRSLACSSAGATVNSQLCSSITTEHNNQNQIGLVRTGGCVGDIRFWRPGHLILVAMPPRNGRVTQELDAPNAHIRLAQTAVGEVLFSARLFFFFLVSGEDTAAVVMAALECLWLFPV